MPHPHEKQFFYLECFIWTETRACLTSAGKRKALQADHTKPAVQKMQNFDAVWPVCEMPEAAQPNATGSLVTQRISSRRA